jgi:hypothetical protein
MPRAFTVRRVNASVAVRADSRAVPGWRVPLGVRVALAIVVLLVAAQFVHDVLDAGGPATNRLFDTWLAVVAAYGAAAACCLRAVLVGSERWTWLAFGLAIASSATGDTLWGLLYADDSHAPIYSICDLFWLAWYPLILLGFGLLLRARLARFELHRWIDGIALAALGATPFVAFVLQPVVDDSGVSGLGAAVTYSYPLWDMALTGAAVGLFALLGWQRPTWALLITAALGIEVVADSLYAVQVVEGTYVRSTYDYLWSVAVLLIAVAAWQRPRAQTEPPDVYGWQAVALPIACQVGGATLSVYSHFHGLGNGEVALAVLLLGIGLLQMVLTRPRPPTEADGGR